MGLLAVPETPASMAEFLRNNPGLDLTIVGEYLGSPAEWNSSVRRAFLKTFLFQGMSLVAALREVLSTFKLPGEAQQIERIMEAFAHQYFLAQPLAPSYNSANVSGSSDAVTPCIPENQQQSDSQPTSPDDLEHSLSSPRWVATESVAISTDPVGPGDVAYGVNRPEDTPVLADDHSNESLVGPPSVINGEVQSSSQNCVLIRKADTIFILSYSIIMLNTDLHNSQVKNKMTLEEFIRNNRGIDDGQSLPPSYLTDIYENIAETPIRLLSNDDAAFLGVDNPLCNDEEYWEKVLGKQSILGTYALSPLQQHAGLHERDMFTVLLQANAVGVILTCLEVSQDLVVIETCLTGLLELSLISCYYGLPNPLATILNALNEKATSYWVPLRSQLAVPVIMQLFIVASHLFRTPCWGAFIDVLLKLFCLGLLPTSLMEFDDFPDISNNRPLKRSAFVRPPPLLLRVARHVLERREGHHQIANVAQSPTEQSSGWLTSIASLLFSVDDDHQPEPVDGLPGQCPAIFCPYVHTGTPAAPTPGLSAITDQDISILLQRQKCDSTLCGRGNVQAPGLVQPTSPIHTLFPGATTVPLLGSASNTHVGQSIVESSCPYFVLKNKLSDTFRTDEMLMDRFRRLSLPALSSLVLTLAAFSLPVSSQTAILGAIRRRTERIKQTATHVAASSGQGLTQTTLPSDSELSRTLLDDSDRQIYQILQDKLQRSHAARQPPPKNKSAFFAVRPNLPALQAFRESYDSLFCLELLTNLVCVRLHSECLQKANTVTTTSGASAPAIVSPYGTNVEAKTPPGTLAPKIGFTAGTVATGVVESPLSATKIPTSFLDTLWPLTTHFYESILSWYNGRIPAGSLNPADDEQADTLVLPAGCERSILTQFPDAMALLRLVQHIPLGGKSSQGSLNSQDLLFMERVIVSVLRLCVRLSHVTSRSATSILCRYIWLLGGLHPQLFALHTERIVAALHQLFPVNHGLSLDISPQSSESFIPEESTDIPHNETRPTSHRLLQPLSTTTYHSTASLSTTGVTSRSAIIVALLALCERCAPVQQLLFVPTLVDLPQNVPAFTPPEFSNATVVTTAVLEMLKNWLHSPSVMPYLWKPSSASDQGPPVLKPSTPFLSLLHVLVLFSLRSPVEEHLTGKTSASELPGTQAFDHSTTLKAFKLLIRLSNGGFLPVAPMPTKTVGDAESTEIGFPSAPENRTESNALPDHWHHWLFPLLQALSIVAACSSTPVVRALSLEVLQSRLASIGIGLSDSYTEKCQYMAPTTWNSVLLPQILIPLFTYTFPYSFLKEHRARMTELAGMDLFQSQTLAVIVTPRGAELNIGTPELFRRKAHAVGFVSRQLLYAYEGLLRYGETEEHLSCVKNPSPVYGDSLCSAIATVLVHLAIEATTTPSQSVQESCWETFKNTILVLADALARDPKFDAAQKDLPVERFAIPLMLQFPPQNVANPVEDSGLQWISRCQSTLGGSVVILRLGYYILRRALPNPQDIWDTICTTFPPPIDKSVGNTEVKVDSFVEPNTISDHICVNGGSSSEHANAALKGPKSEGDTANPQVDTDLNMVNASNASANEGSQTPYRLPRSRSSTNGSNEHHRQRCLTCPVTEDQTANVSCRLLKSATFPPPPPGAVVPPPPPATWWALRQETPLPNHVPQL